MTALQLELWDRSSHRARKHPSHRLAPEATFSVAFFSGKNRGESTPEAALRRAAAIPTGRAARFARLLNQLQAVARRHLQKQCAGILRGGATEHAMSEHHNRAWTDLRKAALPFLFAM